MLNWIKGGKGGHPMADLKRARELVAELPSDTPLRALEEVTHWLGSINDEPDFKLKNRLDAVDLLDRVAKNHQFKLAPEYLEAPRLQKVYESRLWNTSFGFWKALGSSYLQCIEQYQGGAAGTDAVAKDLPMIAGRALRTLTLQLKWILLRYGLIEERIWRDIGRAYLFAESQGFATRRAQVYPGAHGDSTVQEEFLKALMLVVSAPDGLPPAKVHIAERVVAHFGSRFVVQPRPGAGCGYCFDLSLHRPPARVTKQVVAGPMMRYFGAGGALEGLRELAKTIREKDGIPRDVNLGGDFDKGTVASVLEHLEHYWGDKVPARSGIRREIATRVTVVPGFPGILNWVQAVTDESSLEFSDPENAESWIVHNMSDGGYGAVVPKMKGDWLQVGRLVGVRIETSNLCRVGIVRRMTRDKYDQRRVGIQVLETAALPVTVVAAAASGTEAARPGEPAVLLSSRPDHSREVALVMRPGAFNPKRNVQIALPGGTYVLTPVRLTESGEDYDCVRYRVTGRA